MGRGTSANASKKDLIYANYEMKMPMAYKESSQNSSKLIQIQHVDGAKSPDRDGKCQYHIPFGNEVN